MLEGLNVHAIPLWLIWEDESIRDGVDIDQLTFYARLKNSETLPTTSQPSPGDFEAFFKEVATDADAIVNVLVSSKVSGTVDSAQTAQNELPELPIRIVDSLTSSMALGFIVQEAAKAAVAGKSLDEVVAAAEGMRDKVNILFMVDTLEYLHRAGRITGARRMLGTALNIKPILEFNEGFIVPASQARTKSRAIARLLELVEEKLSGKQMAEAGVVDVDNPEDGDAFASMVQERFGPKNIIRSGVSPVVGTIVGPGTFGVAFYPEE
jgi:DegV family protein with EDD domain